MSQVKVTPLISQYFEIKEQYPDAVLLFQVGDFYELFFDDAKVVASFLALALTKRGTYKEQDIPLCGVPVHALNHYLVKLVKGGFKVAICDQVEKPQPGTVVKRRVTRVFTPGTLTDASMLDEKSASYLVALYPVGTQCGIAFIDLLGSQIAATTIAFDSYRQLDAELARFLPDEILLPSNKMTEALKRYVSQQGYAVGLAEAPSAEDPQVASFITQQFLPVVGERLSERPLIRMALGLVARYLNRNNPEAITQLSTIHFYEPDDFLLLDAATQKNLEVVQNSHDSSSANTLFSALDAARTSMGSRTIKKWLQRPLIKQAAIEHRLDVVQALATTPSLLFQLSDLLGRISDLERIVGRIALQRAVLPDFIALKHSMRVIPELQVVMRSLANTALGQAIGTRLQPMPELVQLLDAGLDEEGSAAEPIKAGFDNELDRLRQLAHHGQQAILALEQREIEKTGIGSLKIRYTDAFGYAIEVTQTHQQLIPSHYTPKQTLVGRTRYITEELKALEAEILHARERLAEVHAAVFVRVKGEVVRAVRQLREIAQAIAMLDALVGFASVAYERCYVRPQFNVARNLRIVGGRHPVVELTVAQAGGEFVANDTALTDQESLWIVTGPNMGGKSTYLRQVALLQVMAQAGSFVPAISADLAIVDRIFTRIGSGDNLAAGKSTFLVEMEETALICREATAHSLVILDEVGRGTSTFDGMALAQAIIEYLFASVGARTLFATHYHEITKLERQLPGIVNYSLACQKGASGLSFLHKVVRGPAQGSFGLQVAELAGLPVSVIARADVLLREFSALSKL